MGAANNSNGRALKMVNIVEKAVQVNGRETLVQVLALGDAEGWTVPQAAKYLGCSQPNVKQLIKEHGVVVVTMDYDQMQVLKSAKVIPVKTTRANFLPKDSIKQLVKVVNTPEAWAVYNQLWDVADAVKSGRVMEAQLALDVSKLDALDALDMALKGWREERTSHETTKLNSLIGSDELVQLDLAIKQKCAAFQPQTFTRNGLIKKLVKARFARQRPGGTYKEISKKDFPDVIPWVEALTEMHLGLAQGAPNTEAGLRLLNAALLGMERHV